MNTFRTLSGRSLHLLGVILEKGERHHDLVACAVFLLGICGVIAAA